MNTIYLIIISIIVIIILLLVKITEKQSNVNTIAEYLYDTENDRNIAMNGIDMKYYISFSFHYKLFKLFELIKNKFEEKSINYFLICGGLIGYYRHNSGFIPWDDDIDIGVMEEDKDKIYQAMNELVGENDSVIFRTEGAFVNYGIDKIIYKNSEKNAIAIDLFYFKYMPEKNYYHYINNGSKMWPNEYLYKDDIYPLKTVKYVLYDIYGDKFKEIDIKIPNQSTKYLDRAYKNWETIKKPKGFHTKYTKLMFS